MVQVDKSDYAFPQPLPQQNGNGDWFYSESPGMTLRDWFAGQALASSDTDSWVNTTASAYWCYQIADAMLTARKGE